MKNLLKYLIKLFSKKKKIVFKFPDKEDYSGKPRGNREGFGYIVDLEKMQIVD